MIPKITVEVLTNEYHHRRGRFSITPCPKGLRLGYQGACLYRTRQFIKLFPKGSSITRANLRKAIDAGLNIPWFTFWFICESSLEIGKLASKADAKLVKAGWTSFSRKPVRIKIMRACEPELWAIFEAIRKATK